MSANPRYFQVDVFPATRGGGNPLGVVLDAGHWPDARMQAFAAWTDLVETTFVLAPRTTNASYRVRIFTPTREIPYAGHPTIGSAHVVLSSGFATPVASIFQQECGAGLIKVQVDGDGPDRQLFVLAPSASVVTEGELARAALAPLLDDASLGALPPALVEGGRRWWIAELADATLLREWQPDHAAIAALAARSDSLGLCLWARAAASDHDVVVRAFPSGVGIAEDPASGAANGLIAAYIAAREPDDVLARGYTVSQGREIGHDARIVVRYVDGATWVGGRATTVISGTLDWPAD